MSATWLSTTVGDTGASTMAAPKTDFAQWFEAQSKGGGAQQAPKSSSFFSSPFTPVDVEAGGASAVAGRAPAHAPPPSFFASVRSRLSLGPSPAPQEYTFGLSTVQRYQSGAILLCGSLVLYTLALFVFLPLILLAPAKFASAFTFASLMWLAALACVRGPRATLAGMVGNGNTPVTAAYVASMALSLYATLVVQSYFLIVLAVVVQLGSAAWYSASFLPGGSAGMGALSRWVLGGWRPWR